MRFEAHERLADHSFDDADEHLHTPPSGGSGRWQENLFFIAWNVDAGHGVLIHTKRWPARSDHEAHVVVFVDGQVSSAVLHRPTGATGATVRIEDEIPELSAHAEVPWARWRIQSEFDGSGGDGPFGFLAHRASGPVRASIDITLESDLPPADFNLALASWSTELASRGGQHTSTQQHYEQGGRWRGTLRVGDAEVTTSGLYVRDHSWGERVETNFDSGVFWTASALDDGHIFCNAIGFPSATGTIGTGIVVCAEGTFTTRQVSADFSPEPGLRSYDSSRVRYGFAHPLELDGRTVVHVPKYLPGSGERRYDNNAISRVRIGDHVGMGCIEWAAVLDHGRASVLDELLHDRSGSHLDDTATRQHRSEPT